MIAAKRILALFCLLICATNAQARIGLVVGEPFGSFGTMLPVGHASILLDDFCTAPPTQLRACIPGEQPGVVVSRYHDLRHPALDWLAFPASIFFYGVANPADAPEFVTPELETELRVQYRENHLLEVVPDHNDKVPAGDWQEGIGAAFDRRLLVYMVGTTASAEVTIMKRLNGDTDARHYTLRRHNCADFAAELLALALPTLGLHRNKLADFDIMTPKQLARSIDAFAATQTQPRITAYEVPQIPGTLRRSRPLRGASDTFLKTKRYLVTLLVLQPEFVLADWIAYEDKGKWRPHVQAVTVAPTWLTQARDTPLPPALSSEPSTPGS